MGTERPVIVDIRRLCKSYRRGNQVIPVLEDISLTIAEARDRLTAARIALGESREPAYHDLFADALAKLQGLVRAAEGHGDRGQPA